MSSIRAVTVAMMLLRPLLFPLVLAAEWACHVDAACPVAGPGSRGRGGDRGDVRVPEDGAAAGGDRPGPAGRVAARRGVRGRVRGPGTPGLAAVAAGAGHGAAAGREPDRPDGRGGGPDPAGLEVPARPAPGRPGVRPLGAAGIPGEGRGRGTGAGAAGRAAGAPCRGRAGEGGREAAHRFHARGRGGRGAEPAGTGRGERPGRGRGPDGCAPGLGGRLPCT